MKYNLVDLSNGQVIEQLNNDHLLFLMDNFDVDDLYNTNFYINQDTLESIKEDEPEEEMVQILEKTLKGREEADFGIEAVYEGTTYKVTGKLINKDNKTPIQGALVKAIDEDLLGDDFLGYAYSKEDGSFEINFEEADFSNLLSKKIEKKPDIYLEISILNKDVDREWVSSFVKKEAANNEDFGEIEISLDEFL